MMARILIVDDDADTRNYLSEVLAFSGHTTTVAATYDPARDALDTDTFDLLIVDAHLGDGNGLDLVAEGSAHGHRTVLISGHPPSMKALDKLGVDYLQKPFGVPELTAALDRALSRR